MPKKFFKRFLPSPEKIQAQKGLAIFARWLKNPNLWALNRRSVSGATAIGLFVAFIPVPFQMTLSAGLAILLGINLPLSVALVWITNPLTMGPIFYCTYKIGSWLLQLQPTGQPASFSTQWIMAHLKPLLVGNLLCGTMLSLLGYIGVRWFWYYSTSRKWHARKRNRPDG